MIQRINTLLETPACASLANDVKRQIVNGATDVQLAATLRILQERARAKPVTPRATRRTAQPIDLGPRIPGLDDEASDRRAATDAVRAGR